MPRPVLALAEVAEVVVLEVVTVLEQGAVVLDS
jgi:hypothetical protein